MQMQNLDKKIKTILKINKFTTYHGYFQCTDQCKSILIDIVKGKS